MALVVVESAPLAVKFFDTPSPVAPVSNFRNISHNVVELGNLSKRRPFGIPCASDSGSWRATDTTEGERES
jgi:hypothetical protein